MNLKIITCSLFGFLFAPLLNSAQTLSCSDLKNGVFVFFSSADGSSRIYTRNREMQKEFSPATHETVNWDVEWVSDCAYYLKYNSGLEDKPKQTQELLKKHKFLFQILSVTDDYYIFQSTLDNASNPVISKDTLWIKQRSDAKRKVTTNPKIDSLLALRKAVFDSVVSKAAFLYVFRPGKFAESLVSYTLCLNDVPICEMANKASYIIRLSKEGQTTFVAKVKKQETSITINVKSGNKYFLRCELPWSLAPKPKLTEVTREEAQPYFDSVIK
ncbi:MAG: hypothetical protein J0H74_07030 [Chitinophagaceae bacterium]|nr:hypothetical protein [Chitinophagaceae bacterium]